MKFFLATSLIAAASAFAPAAQPKASTSLASAYENELGVVSPTGFFDPFGLSENIDQETFDQYRTAELKHGRVAMLGVLGYIFPEFTRAHYDFIPGEISTDTIPNGIKAIDAIPALGWAQIIFFIGAVDYYGFLGDFDAGKKPAGKDDIEELKLNELQNGRLAMLAFIELLRHDCHVVFGGGALDDGITNLIPGLPFLYE